MFMPTSDAILEVETLAQVYLNASQVTALKAGNPDAEGSPTTKVFLSGGQYLEVIGTPDDIFEMLCSAQQEYWSDRKEALNA